MLNLGSYMLFWASPQDSFQILTRHSLQTKTHIYVRLSHLSLTSTSAISFGAFFLLRIQIFLVFSFKICIMLLQYSNYALGPCTVGSQSHQNHGQDPLMGKIALPRRRSAATARTPDVWSCKLYSILSFRGVQYCKRCFLMRIVLSLNEFGFFDMLQTRQGDCLDSQNIYIPFIRRICLRNSLITEISSWIQKELKFSQMEPRPVISYAAHYKMNITNRLRCLLIYYVGGRDMYRS